MHINKLIVAGFCFMILAIPPLVFNQGSVAVDALAWICVMALAGSVLGVLVPRSAHLYLFVVVLAWLVLGVGLAETGGVLLWLASAWSLGVLVMRRLHKEPDLHASATEAVVLGGAIWLAVWGGMLHFAINYRGLYLVLCLLPCVLLANQAPVIRADLHSRATAAQEWMRAIPLWSWVAGLTIIGWVLRWTSFPSMGYDDHALHLRIWTELLTQQRYTFDIHTQIWSVAPFAVDLLHAGLSLMAGHDARSAMNLALATLLLLLMARILHNWKLAGWAQWLLVVLMASTPMLGYLLLSLQTELVLAVLALAGMRLLIDANGGWRGRHVLGVLACAALCAGIKLSGAVLSVTLLAALAVRWWSQRGATPMGEEHLLRWPALLVLIPLGFVALHSYALAWKVTGNPVFPLYNAIFLSPFFAPENFSDTRWIQGFSFLNYLRAFFYTSKFFEGGNYTAGWQYLFLLPIAILATFCSGIPNSLRIALIPVLGFGLVIFSATQYWRYLFPVMPIAGGLLAVLFIGKNRNYQTFIVALTVACIAFNLVFFRKVSWMMNSPAAAAFTTEGKKNVTRLYAPAALLTQKINQLVPAARVLYPSDAPYGATLHGSPLYVNWYAPSRAAQFASLKSTKEIGEFLAQERVDFVITSMSDVSASGSPEALLRDYLSRFGSALAQEGSFILYRLSETPTLYRKVFDLGASIRETPGEAELLLPFSETGILAFNEPKRLALVQTYRAKQARYTVDFNCPLEDGFFVVKINWDKGAAYYRAIACTPKTSSFVEVVPVPIGASTGMIYVTARDTASVHIENLSVEVH